MRNEDALVPNVQQSIEEEEKGEQSFMEMKLVFIISLLFPLHLVEEGLCQREEVEQQREHDLQLQQGEVESFLVQKKLDY
jgi:hypothetical protein